MNVIVDYAGGATLTYSLNAFNAWEGYNLAFNGTKGRLEHSLVESAFVAGSDAQAREGSREKISTRIIPLRGAPREIEPRTGAGGHGGGGPRIRRGACEPPQRAPRHPAPPPPAPRREPGPRPAAGGHGGGDQIMLRDIFDPAAPADPLLRSADE